MAGSDKCIEVLLKDSVARRELRPSSSIEERCSCGCCHGDSNALRTAKLTVTWYVAFNLGTAGYIESVRS